MIIYNLYVILSLNISPDDIAATEELTTSGLGDVITCLTTQVMIAS